jgi:hypothetical protein
MEIIIEKRIMPNGFIKITAVDSNTGIEAYVCQRYINESQIEYMTQISIKKLLKYKEVKK